jgi:hypothetical protein
VARDPDFYIFRDVRRRTDAATLTATLRSEITRLPYSAKLDDLLALLLRAGELECALEDAHVPAVESTAASNITNAFAAAALSCDSLAQPYDACELRQIAVETLDAIHSSCAVNIGTPEGFAYYALHPLDYADLVERLGLRAPRAVVIGIRSIGTTLSAVVAAKLRQLGIAAERMTVRPMGHPYHRQSRFALWQKEVIARAAANGAAFLVCDEGPGRSGSSLLSVAEALEALEAPADRILTLCSHDPDIDVLCAPDAARRWSRFRSAATGMTRRLPPDANDYIGGGEWRRIWFAANESWPPTWPQMERVRFLSRDRKAMLTFEGHGHYGAPVRARNQALSDSGFGTTYLRHENGFGVHSLPTGRLARRRSVTPELLAHLGAYCAWRAKEFRDADARCDDLEVMARTNFEREFNRPLQDLGLPIESPAICDNRMSPHSWLLAADGRWLKLDAAIHGDDHFFPGPCDIAWDLAGLMVEWSLGEAASEQLLAHYSRETGDDVASRIHSYEIAYATLRLAWSKMALGTSQGSDEEPRLAKNYRRYRRLLQRLAPEASRKGCETSSAQEADSGEPNIPIASTISVSPADPCEDHLL